MEKFIIGVNYWASNAGADMWRYWDENTVIDDLDILKSNGIQVLRVFPNWRDFQPVEPIIGQEHKLKEYRMTGDQYPENLFYLDEIMLKRFHRFCQIAEEKGLEIIVGLITGWMSGRLYIPSALFGKNIYTDPTALNFQQLFIKGFVENMKVEKSIIAWDFGNECNCMDKADSREEACNWSGIIANAIRACDMSRPIVSGMHSLEIEGVWNIQDQGEKTDMLTTHTYPFWVEHCHFASLTDYRTLLHATAQTQYYATVSKKPCLVEEIGSMGPMVASEENAAGFLKVNLWSNWANGASGVMWWCAHDQSNLTAPPYDWNMCERELGMISLDRKPKPSILEIKNFVEEQKKLNLDLPYRETDAVCIMTQGQDSWGIAYMSYILAKQAELSLDFTYCEQELPDSDLYFLPSATSLVMSKRSYDVLKKRVYEGATLYISIHDGIFTEFEELTGFRVESTCRREKHGTADWQGTKILYKKSYEIQMTAKRAEILLEDEENNPLFSVASYGAGKVFVLNFPLEEMLLTSEDGFMQKYYSFYSVAGAEVLAKKPIRRKNLFTGITLHKGENEDYAVIVNYSDKTQELGLKISEDFYRKITAVYGNEKLQEPFATTVLRLEK